MITKFKIFENNKTEIGDYIIFGYNRQPGPFQYADIHSFFSSGLRADIGDGKFTRLVENQELAKFINNNIGQIVNMTSHYKPSILVQYSNIPEVLNKNFTKNGSVWLFDVRILATGKTPDEVKMKINAIKYNL